MDPLPTKLRILDAAAKVFLEHGFTEAAMDQVRQEVTSGLAQGRRKVILQADGDLPHGEVMKVASTISELDGVTLHIGVQEPQ